MVDQKAHSLFFFTMIEFCMKITNYGMIQLKTGFHQIL